MMPRDARLSDSCALDRCSFSSVESTALFCLRGLLKDCKILDKRIKLNVLVLFLLVFVYFLYQVVENYLSTFLGYDLPYMNTNLF